MCHATGTVLEKHQISTYFLFGKTDRALISKSEIEQIKNVKQPSGIRILGFKPSSYILPMHQLRNPTFIYPDDEHLQGSTTALTALHRSMIQKDVVAICGVKVHARSPERLGAMVAQKGKQKNTHIGGGGVVVVLVFSAWHVVYFFFVHFVLFLFFLSSLFLFFSFSLFLFFCLLSSSSLFCLLSLLEIVDSEDDRHQIEPPGFQIIFLPFADDIRQVTDSYYNREQATEAQTAAAVDVIKNGRIGPFSSSTFENPKLAKHYACVQALALFKDETGFDEENGDDEVKPDEEGQKLYLEPKVRVFMDTLPELIEPVKKVTGKKRKAAAAIPPEEAKQQKVDMHEIWKEGMVKKQSVSRLKGFLKSQGLPVSGKKADLVERVSKLYE